MMNNEHIKLCVWIRPNMIGMTYRINVKWMRACVRINIWLAASTGMLEDDHMIILLLKLYYKPLVMYLLYVWNENREKNNNVIVV